jgi:hypothetical protein
MTSNLLELLQCPSKIGKGNLAIASHVLDCLMLQDKCKDFIKGVHVVEETSLISYRYRI